MLKRLLVIGLSCCSVGAFAANAAPFDQEIGVVKCPDVIKNLSDRVTFESNGLNKYTGGEMYLGNADKLGFSGAKAILLICDKNTTLSAMQITLSKDSTDGGFDRYNKMLKSKYKLVKLINPFVGDKMATYTKNDSTIMMIAPHMSFDMTITYSTKQLMQKVDAVNKQEDKSKFKQQQNSL